MEMTHHARALELVTQERLRQEQFKADGRFSYTCADDEMSDADAIAALGEEFGEVCEALLAHRSRIDATNTSPWTSHLQEELVQVAAVAVAWVERLIR